jgi:hypothetical protein
MRTSGPARRTASQMGVRAAGGRRGGAAVGLPSSPGTGTSAVTPSGVPNSVSGARRWDGDRSYRCVAPNRTCPYTVTRSVGYSGQTRHSHVSTDVSTRAVRAQGKRYSGEFRRIPQIRKFGYLPGQGPDVCRVSSGDRRRTLRLRLVAVPRGPAQTASHRFFRHHPFSS